MRNAMGVWARSREATGRAHSQEIEELLGPNCISTLGLGMRNPMGVYPLFRDSQRYWNLPTLSLSSNQRAQWSKVKKVEKTPKIGFLGVKNAFDLLL